MRRLIFALPLVALATLVVLRFAAADSTVVLGNNVLRSISVLTPTGPTDPARVISIGVGLQGGDPTGELSYLAGEYDPSSPLYQQFLDPDQYEQRFGVPSSRFNAAVSWLQSGGLTVQTIPGVSQYILASGTVAQIQSLLGISIADFHVDWGTFHANTNAPKVPANLGVIGIAGLNDLEGPRLASRQNLAARPSTVNPNMDTGLTAPSDLWSIYDQPSNNKGEGQQMAIFGWGTTNNTLSDLRLFEAERGLPAIPVTIQYFGAETSITDSGGEVEWDLDTQASTGMAPNAVALKLYFGKAGTDADLVAAYHAWGADKQGPLQGSSSFSGCEEAPGADQASGTGGVLFTGNPKQDLWEAALRRAVIEGRTMFASTGDTGAGCPVAAIVLNGVTLIPTPWMGYPAVSPNAVGVGGTVLYFNDATATSPASRALEYTWNYTGGGSSLYLAAGNYQNTTPPILLARCATDPHGNPYSPPLPLCRGTPDVAAQSGDIVSNGYQITVAGKKDQSGGGTSLSSPLWLGMWTRIQAAGPKKGNGFANYALYGAAQKNAATFFDIGGVSTETSPNCNGEYCSHLGWDYTSGWGSPDVTNLMTAIAGQTAPTRVTSPNPPPTITPTITGTTCPGPQIVDATNDAPNDYPAGDGSNMDNLDIVSASFSSPDAATLRVTLTIKNLAAPPPPVNLASAIWAVFWNYNGTTYYARAESTGALTAAAFTFDDGTYTSNFNPVNQTIHGTATPGPNGTFVIDVPLADVGSPPAGASLTLPFAESHGSFQAVYYTAAADRAPDLGFGASWTVGATCP
jgi:pseudomonalisin